MSQDQRFLTTPLSRRRFLQYTGSMALSGSLLAACAGSGGTMRRYFATPNSTRKPT